MEEKNLEIENSSEGFTLLELFETLKRNIWLLLSIGFVIVAIGVIYTWFIVTPMYTSTVDLQIYIEHEETSGADNTKATIVVQVANNIKAAVQYPSIIQNVIYKGNIGYSDIQSKIKSIANNVEATTIGSAAAVRISYTDPDPLVADKIVVLIAEEVKARTEIPIGQEGSLRFATEKLSIINKPIANANHVPSSPNKMLNLVISVLLGGIVGVVVVILKEQFSQRFKSKNEIEKFTNLPVLTVIPTKEDAA